MAAFGQLVAPEPVATGMVPPIRAGVSIHADKGTSDPRNRRERRATRLKGLRQVFNALRESDGIKRPAAGPERVAMWRLVGKSLP